MSWIEAQRFHAPDPGNGSGAFCFLGTMQAILFFSKGKKGDAIAFYNRLPVFLSRPVDPPALLLVDLRPSPGGRAYLAHPLRQARYIEFGARAWHPLSGLFDGSVDVRRQGHSSDTSVMFIWDETLEQRFRRRLRELAEAAGVAVSDIESQPVEDPGFWLHRPYISTDPLCQAYQLLGNWRKHTNKR